jgi:hypothetical protein
LSTTGKPTLVDEGRAAASLVDPGVARAGDAGAREHVLHPRLVAEVARSPRPHSFDAKPSRTSPSGTWSCSSAPSKPRHGADLARDLAPSRRRSARGSRPSAIRRCAASIAPQVRRAACWHRVLAHRDRTPDTWQIRHRVARSASVVSSKKGATKTTERIRVSALQAAKRLHVVADLVGQRQRDRQVGVADDQEAVRNQRLPPVPARCADRQQVLPDDHASPCRRRKSSRPTMRRIAPLPPRPLVDVGHVEAAARRAPPKLPKTDRLRPASEDVDVAGVVHLVDLVRAGRSAADLAENRFAARRAGTTPCARSRCSKLERREHPLAPSRRPRPAAARRPGSRSATTCGLIHSFVRATSGRGRYHATL